MKEVWVLSITTSLPDVHFDGEPMENRMHAFDSFPKARDALRKILKGYAFSKNKMFDSKGNMTFMKQYMDEIEDFEGSVEDAGWLSSQVGAKLLTLFHDIFSGKDTKPELDAHPYEDGFIQVDVHGDRIAFLGIDDGPCNGYSPVANTNMFSMQEEKDYYLYLNDMFGDTHYEASSELYIDLKKVSVL